MKTTYKVTEIIKIEPFKITCRWSNGEIRVIDFEPIIKKWNLQTNELSYKLTDYEVFKYASIGEGNTICWPNIPIQHFNFTRGEISSPLSLCPNTLYSESKPINNFKLVEI
jgi:hypothetical protein